MKTETLEQSEPKVLLKKDTQREFDLTNAAGEYTPFVENLMRTWKAMNLAQVNLDTLAKHQQDYETFVKEFVYENNAAFKALGLDKAKGISMQSLPEGYPAFASAMEAYKDILRKRPYFANIATTDKYWTFDKRGHCCTSPAYDQYVEAATCTYATPKQIEIERQAQAIVEAINQLKELIGNSSIQVIPASHGHPSLIGHKHLSSEPVKVNKELILFIK